MQKYVFFCAKIEHDRRFPLVGFSLLVFSLRLENNVLLVDKHPIKAFYICREHIETVTPVSETLWLKLYQPFGNTLFWPWSTNGIYLGCGVTTLLKTLFYNPFSSNTLQQRETVLPQHPSGIQVLFRNCSQSGAVVTITTLREWRTKN